MGAIPKDGVPPYNAGVLPLLVFVDDLASDPRLKATTTFAERYLPLPQFAERLAAATKAPIGVEPSMSGRKLVLFVDDRPAAETMARVADALGSHWIVKANGWSLIRDGTINEAERAAPAARDAARRKALAEWVGQTIEKPGDSRDTLRQATSALLRDAGAGTATSTLLAGKALVGTADGRAGSRPLSMLQDAFSRVQFSKPGGGLYAPPTNAMILLRFDPETGRVITSLRSLGGESRTGTMGWSDPLLEAKPGPDAMDRLDDAWAGDGGAAVGDARLKPGTPEPDPYGAGLASLSDVLAGLHARTGLPLAAESFRAPVTPWGAPKGETVREALRAVLDGPMVKFGGVPRFVWRGSEGWLLVRTPAAWSLRRGEIPESRLVPLEAKRTPSLDDYAALAGSMNEAQRVELERFRPLATFPTVALRVGFWGLDVYDALPAAARKAAALGIAFGDLPPLAQERWRRAVVEQVDRKIPPEAWVDAVLGDRIPPDAAFQAVLEDTFVEPYDLGPFPTDFHKAPSYHSVTFRFGAGKDPVTVRAPLAPAAP